MNDYFTLICFPTYSIYIAIKTSLTLRENARSSVDAGEIGKVAAATSPKYVYAAGAFWDLQQCRLLLFFSLLLRRINSTSIPNLPLTKLQILRVHSQVVLCSQNPGWRIITINWMITRVMNQIMITHVAIYSSCLRPVSKFHFKN